MQRASENAEDPNVCSLGFGFFGGARKLPLVEVPRPPPLEKALQVGRSFEWSPNVLSAESRVSPEQVFEFRRATLSYGCQGSSEDLTCDGRNGSSFLCQQRQQLRGQAVGLFTFKKLTHKRAIATPRFHQLLPVQAMDKRHVDGTRWRVEAFGNSICTEEYVGGEAQMLFVLKQTLDREQVAHRFAQIEQSLMNVCRHDHKQKQKEKEDQETDTEYNPFDVSIVSNESSKLVNDEEMECRALIRGFSCPHSMTLTSLKDVRVLVSELGNIPIEASVPVTRVMTPIVKLSGFPKEIKVVQQPRETAILGQLAVLLEQLERPLQTQSRLKQEIVELLVRLMHTIDKASLNDRSQLDVLRMVANDLLIRLALHGKKYELYQHRNEFRLRREACDAKATRAKDCILHHLGSTFLRSCRFTKAPAWQPPQDYTAQAFEQHRTVLGHYHRVKVELVFTNAKAVRRWRQELDRVSSLIRARAART